MENLEQYILSKDNEHPLVKIGIIHYQFEAIHPFLMEMADWEDY